MSSYQQKLTTAKLKINKQQLKTIRIGYSLLVYFISVLFSFPVFIQLTTVRLTSNFSLYECKSKDVTILISKDMVTENIKNVMQMQSKNELND